MLYQADPVGALIVKSPLGFGEIRTHVGNQGQANYIEIGRIV